MDANDTIVSAAIFPTIGIARVGNSAEEYFIGPELPHVTPDVPGGYKDAQGALKRQAARFRIYGYNAAGEVVAEITADTAKITWGVHVANTKAAWYNFEGPMDLADAVPTERRNPDYAGEVRKGLKIDPGRREISGPNQSGPEFQFDSGRFLDTPVYLGELRTDEAGRLLFLGGRGVSGTPLPQNNIATYANNRGWHDDVSDGPVRAQVTIGGRKIPVEPAWVVVAPPNYGPGLNAIVSLHDVLFDAYQGWFFEPLQTVNFTEHVLPILRRFCEMQWVNFGFFLQFGWKAPFDFTREGYIERMGSSSPEYKEARQQVFNLFRDPAATVLQINQWPPVYGDDVQIPPQSPGSMLSVTPTQYRILQSWAAGDFQGNWPAMQEIGPVKIEDLPLPQQPEALNRAALSNCSGGPFHPGCEMTWIMRHNTLYYAPFRLRPRAPGQPERDYGEVLTPQAAVGENGPLYSSGPGDITRWMAVPWQTDTAGCRAGYTPEYDPYLPSFWPARVPNHVLAMENFQQALHAATPQERMMAFNTRSSWLRWLSGGILTQMQQMITEFGKLGVVTRKDVASPPEGLPPVMFVEDGVGFPTTPPPDKNKNLVASSAARAHAQTARAAGAGS